MCVTIKSNVTAIPSLKTLKSNVLYRRARIEAVFNYFACHVPVVVLSRRWRRRRLRRHLFWVSFTLTSGISATTLRLTKPPRSRKTAGTQQPGVSESRYVTSLWPIPPWSRISHHSEVFFVLVQCSISVTFSLRWKSDWNIFNRQSELNNLRFGQLISSSFYNVALPSYNSVYFV